MANRWGKDGDSDRLYFGGSKITADSGCSHEIKRHLLLGRKAMTNLGSILESRDITLPTKICIAKAMVFPFTMCGYENWTIKKAKAKKLMLSNCGTGEDSWKPLGLQGEKPVNPKGNQSWIFTGRTVAKLKFQYFGHLMWRTNWLEKTLMLGKIEHRRRRD